MVWIGFAKQNSGVLTRRMGERKMLALDGQYFITIEKQDS